MTATSKPSKGKKPKPPTPDSRAITIAKVSGAVAGIPQAFRDAGEALRDAKERCEAATISTGILTPRQVEQLRAIASDMARIMPTIADMWHEADTVIAAGVGVAPKEDPFG